MDDWPVRVILDSVAWQRGYDRLMELAEHAPAPTIANPYTPDHDEWFGFEEGRTDWVRLTSTPEEE